jgi:uncharacterized RDD family membrane protein YckC
MQYAGFWKRAGAIIIDIILLGIVGSILKSVVTNEVVVAAIEIAIGLAYYAGMESSEKQATVGKMVLKIKVVDIDGNRISPARAVGRYFSKILSAIILGIGYIMAAFTEKKQGLHDMIAGTLVVNAE